MIADAGAATLKALLEKPDPQLTSAVEALGSGLAEAEGLEAEVPPSTEAAIAKMRAIYSDMARQIKSIDTDDFSAKNEAMAALTRMDSGLAGLATGIGAGTQGNAESQLARAVSRMEKAGSELERAAAGIG